MLRLSVNVQLGVLLITCWTFEFAVIRLLGGVEMLFDQKRARHLEPLSHDKKANITGKNSEILP